jgi:dihydropteroate synthase
MTSQPAPLQWGPYAFVWGARTYVMGILNITPDSFSGDGLAPADATPEDVVAAAVEQGLAMIQAGADVLDVGGESTRPVTAHQEPLDAATERARVVPVIRALVARLPVQVPISIDTSKAEVAAAALDAGASLVNDVTGLARDAALAPLVASRGVPVVVMSNVRGLARRDPLGDVARQLAAGLERALAAGIPWEHVILDPGIGFGLHAAENLEVLRRLQALRAFGRPLLVGTSRKSTIGAVLGGAAAGDRLEGTAATVALSIAHGADMVRVHDVRAMVRVARMSDAVVRGWTP